MDAATIAVPARVENRLRTGAPQHSMLNFFAPHPTRNALPNAARRPMMSHAPHQSRYSIGTDRQKQIDRYLKHPDCSSRHRGNQRDARRQFSRASAQTITTAPRHNDSVWLQTPSSAWFGCVGDSVALPPALSNRPPISIKRK